MGCSSLIYRSQYLGNTSLGVLVDIFQSIGGLIIVKDIIRVYNLELNFLELLVIIIGLMLAISKLLSLVNNGKYGLYPPLLKNIIVWEYNEYSMYIKRI